MKTDYATQRTCSTCTAFNAHARPGDPKCLNLTVIDGQDPTGTDWCDFHLDAEESAMLDAELDRVPFDDCADDADEQIDRRINAAAQFNHRLAEARKITMLALARAAW